MSVLSLMAKSVGQTQSVGTFKGHTGVGVLKDSCST